MPGRAHVPPLFNAEQCPAYLHTLRWQDRPLPCPRCRSAPMGRWGTSPYRPGGQRSGCHGGQRTFNDLPATLLPQRQRARSPGFSPPFGAVWPARHGAWPGKGASTAGRAIASAGGDARPPWRMRCPGSWRGRGKPMPSSPPPATRGTQAGAGRSRGDVSPVAVGSNARPGVAMRTRTGEPFSRGAAARARSAGRRPAIAPSCRGKRRPPGRCAQAVGSLPPRRAAPGRGRALSMPTSSPRRRTLRAGTCTSSGPRAGVRGASPPCACCVGSGHTPSQGRADACRFCGIFANAMPLSRRHGSYRRRETPPWPVEPNRGSLSQVLIIATSYKPREIERRQR